MIQIFEQYRPMLFSIAYRMLGSVVEAEDVVQDTFLRVQHLDVEEIDNPGAYLRQITTRLCLDTLKSARTQREVYIGPWLPEPLPSVYEQIVEPEKVVETMDTISMAFMSLLEVLSPAERAVFILRAVFDYDYAEIASSLDKDESACRQLYSRAKKHIAANRPRYERDEKQHDDLLQSFLLACKTGNTGDIESILASEVVVTVDGGGQVSSATRPVYGRERVAKFFIGIFKKGLWQAQFKFVNVNHQQAILASDGVNPVALFIFDCDEASIHNIWTIRNPDKLALFKTV